MGFVPLKTISLGGPVEVPDLQAHCEVDCIAERYCN